MFEARTKSPDLQLLYQIEDGSIYRAKLGCDPGFEVVIKAIRNSSPRARREVHMWKQLAAARERLGSRVDDFFQGILPVLDMRETDEWSFLLQSSADSDLRVASSVSTRDDVLITSSADLEAWRPQISIERSLPMLVDVLHGLIGLKSAGIVHTDLTMEHVVVKDNRAFISDLASGCTFLDNDPSFGCRSFRDVASLANDATNQAPERYRGVPTGPENDVWSVGLTFAEVWLGFPPSAPCIKFTHLDDFDPSADARENIRSAVRRNFCVEKVHSFQALPEPLRQLLQGLLQTHVSNRFSAEEALEQAKVAAELLGVKLPGPQKLLQLPRGWAFEGGGEYSIMR